MSDIPKGRFPKSAHLLRHSDFQRVYQQGRRHFSGNMTVFFLRSAELQSPVSQSEAGAGRQGAAGCEQNSAGTLPIGARTKTVAPQGVRVGFTVSKALGGAVERNRMRRRTREAVRLHLALLGGMAVDVVINPKKSLLSAEFSQISQEVERAFGVIRRTCENSREKASDEGGAKQSGEGTRTKQRGATSQRSGAATTQRSGAVTTKQRGAGRTIPSAADAAGGTAREAQRP